MSRLIPYLLIQQRRRRSQAFQKKSSSNGKYWAFGLLTLLIILIVLLPVVVGFFYASVTRNLPSPQMLTVFLDKKNGSLLMPTTIYDREGKTIIYQYHSSHFQRRFLAIDPNNEEFFSPFLVQYMVAEYEPDFWVGNGYADNWLSVKGPQTIAERLVERLLLWQEPEGLQKNLRMKILAAQITKRFGRVQVLEWFLNSLSYGPATIGADSAAYAYFGKPASQLTRAEAALLVSVSRSPALNPKDAPEAALENQSTLLQKMLRTGQISPEDYDQASKETILFSFSNQPVSIAPAFSRLVINALYQTLDYDRVELGGIRVVSTLDLRIQSQVACTLTQQLYRLKGSQETLEVCLAAKYLPPLPSTDIRSNSIQTSSVVMDPQTGEILALVGDWDGNLENSLLIPHQAGSILTPLVAVNAFARGFTPASLVWDIPSQEISKSEVDSSDLSTGDYHGPMRLRTALANDYLTPIQALMDQLGNQTIWQSASPFGISFSGSQSPATDPLLAGNSANVIEVGELFSTIATLGTRYGTKNESTQLIEPTLFTSITTVDEQSLFQNEGVSSQLIVSPQLAFLVHDVLQDEYSRRESLGFPNLLEIGRPAGAKYGVIQTGDEVWAAGYTPQYVTVVWFGQETNPIDNLNPQIAGGVWYALMQELHQNLPAENWEKPAGITEIEVCSLSGLLPTRPCPETVMEKFIDGTQPVNADNLFRSYKINRETGLLATVFTPPELVEEKTYLNIPREAQNWAKSAGIDLPPVNYDSIQSPNPSPNVNIVSPAIYQFIRSTVEVTGTAGGVDFGSYRLQVGAGLNPQSWFDLIDAQTSPVRNDELAQWDTSTYPDGLYALRLQVIRDDQQIETHTIQVTIDNTAPIVELVYPKAQDILEGNPNGIVTFHANVSDGAGIERVEWWLNDRLLGVTGQFPYSFPARINPGTYTLVVKAFDLAGNQTSTEPLEFELK